MGKYSKGDLSRSRLKDLMLGGVVMICTTVLASVARQRSKGYYTKIPLERSSDWPKFV